MPENNLRVEVISQKLMSDIIGQFNEEIGEDTIVPLKENQMLRMKFGLSAPVLLPSENYLIKKFDGQR